MSQLRELYLVTKQSASWPVWSLEETELPMLVLSWIVRMCCPIILHPPVSPVGLPCELQIHWTLRK